MDTNNNINDGIKNMYDPVDKYLSNLLLLFLSVVIGVTAAGMVAALAYCCCWKYYNEQAVTSTPHFNYLKFEDESNPENRDNKVNTNESEIDQCNKK
tara:strand:- start:13115 stop:13405 length:291 start_codon:yes stop_codon:yes gene_type:complete